MLDRRTLLFGCAALLAPRLASAAPFKVDPKYAPQRVYYRAYPPGSIIVDTGNHLLFLMDDPPFAMRYGIGVGRAGLTFKGQLVVGRKAEWPSWRPTDTMIRTAPQKYARYAGGMPGGPNNPLGARALYLYKDGVDTMLRIHGTTEPASIGRSVSNGCIRMINDHVIDLYNRVPVGSQVLIV